MEVPTICIYIYIHTVYDELSMVQHDEFMDIYGIDWYSIVNLWIFYDKIWVNLITTSRRDRNP